ncbi:uncharacterized protein LOC120128434 [Hibiscus syriacus]|uniref:uncharacterized protein LOC120128434 n=1 Tax=Hibiscus syriacus TaxID=106335 RepID=UPI001924CF1A|nr:uncharacterized protein LOC120128434 [Hibiscus syriacus]
MIISFWNVRGLNNPLKQGQVLQREAKNNVDILCLMETRVKLEKSYELLTTSFENWNVLTNYDFVVNGRIWFLWRKGLDFSLCKATDQSITVKGLFNGAPFIITAIYGSKMESLEENFGKNFGILNQITVTFLGSWEHITQDLQLQEHPFFGPTFLWSNKQSDNFLARKLDRVLINPIWFDYFPHSSMEFLAPGPSDHCMEVIDLHKETHSNRPKPFKIFNCWTLHPDFLNIVSQSWNMAVQGNPMKSLFLKLKHLKESLKQFNKDNFNDISARTRLKREELDRQQILTLRGDDSLEKELELQRELNSLAEAETMFLKQKAKLHWLKEGSKDPEVKECSPTILKGLMQPISSLIDTEALVKEVTSDEIKEVIFSQGNDKAPGPDGFTSLFQESLASGNLESVMGVIIVLDIFYEYSGLKLNAGKCKIFTAGISAHNLESIINYTGFKQGKLPVRYLGVPLVTRKLTDKDCKALLDNIKSRLHQWSRKNLSYAGRVELIKTVLYSVANY